MKRATTVVAMLWLATAMLAQQQTPAPTTPPASDTQSAAPAKRPPQAKTQAEFDAYKAAAAITDPAALEKAADDFAAKFPDSELRVLLYRAAMHGFQSANDGDKMMETGRKILAIDPDDPEALIGVAEVLTERTRDTDLDKQQRWDEANKDAQHALQTIDTDLPVPAGTPQEKVDAYKGYLRSSVYSILGTLAYNQDKYPEAESDYRKSLDAYPSQPDAVVLLRLALALDKQNKYGDALKEADRAVELTQDNTTAGQLARREHDRLVQLTGGIVTSPAATNPAASTQNPPPAGTQNPPPK
ncbi:MAG TPA: tetratricopeptide repeat protein [Terriglobales bacterium]|nr:tetratricopeptide repeat protein [Terriglobales bacterium]